MLSSAPLVEVEISGPGLCAEVSCTCGDKPQKQNLFHHRENSDHRIGSAAVDHVQKKVWSRSFIYREAFGVARKQINNTPHRIAYIGCDIWLYTVMSVRIAYPCLLKNRQIFSVRISETLSLNEYVAARSGLPDKIRKLFLNTQHPAGYCKDIKDESKGFRQRTCGDTRNSRFGACPAVPEEAADRSRRKTAAAREAREIRGRGLRTVKRHDGTMRQPAERGSDPMRREKKPASGGKSVFFRTFAIAERPVGSGRKSEVRIRRPASGQPYSRKNSRPWVSFRSRSST